MGRKPKSRSRSEDLAPRWSKEALTKAEIIEPLRNLEHIPAQRLAETQQIAAQRLGKSSVSAKTIYNWLRDFRANGITGLERKQHRDKGLSTAHPLIVQYIADLLQTESISIAEVHRRAVQKAQEHDLVDEHLPSYDQVKFIASKLSSAARLYGAKGSRAYRNTYELTTRFEADFPGQLFQGDHHLLDILAYNPITERYERPWITAFLDDYSRSVVGFHLSFEHPNSLSIALALVHTLLPKQHPNWIMYGIPSTIYIDNGKDFRSKHIEEVCLHFGIELRAHEAYLARSKGKIERWFRTLEEMMLRYLPGYVGSNVKTRPTNLQPSLTLPQLQQKITTFIIDMYHERVHSTTKEKPRVRWQKMHHPIRTIEREEEIDHILESRTVTVQKDGIRFHDTYYTDTEGLLARCIGKQVRIFYRRDEPAWIHVWERQQSGEVFLCCARQGIDAQTRRNQNRVNRSELTAQRRASKKRLQEGASSRKQGQQLSPHISQEQMAPVQKKLTRDTSVQAPTSRMLRFRYEMEESDDATD